MIRELFRRGSRRGEINAPILNLRALVVGARALLRRKEMRALDPILRERIILHVSAINGCAVCTAVHAPRCPVPLPSADDERTRAAFLYAAARTRGERARLPDAFSRDERRGIRAVVDLFTFNNRFNNTWERWLPGAAARRAKLGMR
jgi:alkylhydroperoxidase family enzyme